MTRFRRANKWAIGVWLVGLALAVLLISRAQFTADLSAFLPRSPSAAQKILVEQLRNGVVSRLVLVGIEQATPDQLTAISHDLAQRLRADPRFTLVHNGEDVVAPKDRDYLWNHRYLLSDAVTPGHFSAQALRDELQNDLELLSSPAGALIKRVLPDDPSGELLHLIDTFREDTQPAKRDGVWFSRDGTRALLIIQTRAAGFDIDRQEDTLRALNAAFGAAQAATGARNARLLASGPGVISVHTRAKIKQDASRLSLLATALVAGVLLFVYRSLTVLALALLPVISGALGGVAAVALGFGSVHGITLGFGTTLIGEAVDYAIYLFTQTAPGVPPEKTLPRIWPTLRLGVLTSIFGFSALLFSSFTGLAQLGLFSIAGLVVAVSVTRWVLPGLLPHDFTAKGSSVLAPLAEGLKGRGRRWRVALALLVVGGAVVIGTHTGGLWDERLSSLSPTSDEEQALDERLRLDVTTPDLGFLLVADAPSQEEALRAAEALNAPLQRLVHDGALGNYDSPAFILPSHAAQLARQQALPPPDTLETNLKAALVNEPFRADVFAPFLKDVQTAQKQPLLDRSDLDQTNLALKLDSLLVNEGGNWIAMLPLQGVRDPAPLRKALAASTIAGVTLLDLKGESDELYHTYLREALLLSACGCLAIALLLGATLRSAKRCLEVLAPLAAAVLVTTALLVLTSGRLTIFHLVGLLLVVAVGSNYALFFERQRHVTENAERTVASLVLANICTVIGFGTLSFSRIPVLHGIGLTVAIGAVLSLIFSAICIVAQPEAAAGPGSERR